MKTLKWTRVSKAQPCAICGKEDWCTTSEIGACCMRVRSDRELSNGGYLHSWGFLEKNAKPKPVKEEKPTYIKAEQILRNWRKTLNQDLSKLVVDLGVTKWSLELLGTVRAPYHDTYGFPMCNAEGRVCGIRLRDMSGKKWAVKGSKQGIFLGLSCNTNYQYALIVEGPTDSAAALSMGFRVIGRPSCLGAIQTINDTCKVHGVRSAVIVADLDDAGLEGATILAEGINIPTAIMMCPAKDLRAFYNNGGNAKTLDAIVKQLVWRRS